MNLAMALASMCGGAYSPAGIAWTGWWIGDNYVSGSWAGTASAGTSGSHTVTEATNKPTVGATLNGHAGVAFNGTNQKLLDTVNTLSAYVAAGGYTIYSVVSVHGRSAGNGSAWTMQAIVTDRFSHWAHGATMNNGSLESYHYDGAEKNVVSTTVALDTPVLFESRFDGSKIYNRIGSNGTENSAAAGNVDAAALASTGFGIGTNWNSGFFFNGTLWEVRVGPLLGDALRADIRAELSVKYGGL